MQGLRQGKSLTIIESHFREMELILWKDRDLTLIVESKLLDVRAMPRITDRGI